MNKDLNEVLNYMKQYVENIYKHDSEPMLTWKDLKLVLDEIERLENIIKEVREYMKTLSDEYASDDYDIKCEVFNKLYYEILDKEKQDV